MHGFFPRLEKLHGHQFVMDYIEFSLLGGVALMHIKAGIEQV